MKIASTATTVLSLLALVAAQEEDPTSQANATVCVSGAHIIVARASGEQPGYGILVTVKNQVLDAIPDSNSIAVPYPATIAGNVTYFQSEPEGVGNLTKLVTDYYNACPTGKMVLMGYSQGAHVVGDVLIGADYVNYPIFPTVAGVSQNIIDNVVAVIMMGDPANVAGQPILVGNSTKNGTFPRSNAANWESTGLVDKTKSYCDANDTYCDSGSSLAVHVGYIGEYKNEATDFVVERFMSANSSSATTSSSTGSSTGSPTSSSTGSPTSSGSAAASSGSSSGAMSLVSGSSSYVLVGAVQCVLTLLLTFAM